MSKRKTRRKPSTSASAALPKPRLEKAREAEKAAGSHRAFQWWLGGVVGFIALASFALIAFRQSPSSASNGSSSPTESKYVLRPKGTITYSKEIAPIISEKCAGCHRPGQAAPFNLLTYADVKKRIRQIRDVTARGFMPPWLPAEGYGEFADCRRLTTEQLGLIQQWISEEAPEGDPSLVPPLPHWSESWSLGQPDLVLTLPRYVLASEGKDVYRNFVVPIPVSATRFVQGVELLPGNSRVVHHAFINVDETRLSRHLAEKENPPGFDGMELPESAGMPGGQLLGWQPGKIASLADPGLSWVLKTNTDLVLQMHLHPSGKQEVVEPKVGFYFTEQPPTTVPFRIRLVRFDFELPAGASNCVVEQSYELPVDVDLLRILPHCHYLGKDLQAYATLPNGDRQWLIWIRDWDFNWQGDYKFAHPVSLPKGTKLVMHYTYDNSTNNLHNPNSPPRTVHHGLQTTDEMAALALQAVTHSPRERSTLSEDYFKYFRRVSLDSFKYRLQINPGDTEAHIKLARALFSQGHAELALDHLKSAIKIRPEDDRAHYELGFIYLRQNRLAEAYEEFQKVIRLNPDDYEAFGSLGLICLSAGKTFEARQYLEAALRLNPQDVVARRNLERLGNVRPPDRSPVSKE